ncbi:hypothetical protein SH661x_001165 [Planctomicrobium sp. SH661]|uniref:hypothetical protein n=1 Tax=Planctomicrobium sp. SH661 TaxID=3448124 RepID=UPI003F5B23EC
MARRPAKQAGNKIPDSHPENTATAGPCDEVRHTGPGAPIEHYHGEPTRGERTGSPGDLEEVTLDKNAPYNRTYGLESHPQDDENAR